MKRIVGRTRRTIRRFAGEDSAIEKRIRDMRNLARYKTEGSLRRTQIYACRGASEQRFGIFGYGGCDVWSIVDAGPILRSFFDRTVAISAPGRAQFTRSDLILQAHDGVNHDLVRETVEKMSLDPIAFEPVLFDKDFLLPDYEALGRYPKDVVVLTTSTDMTRTLYRHREHGFLADPGGSWLDTDLRNTLTNLDAVKWFSKAYKKTGRLTIEESMGNLRRLIGLSRELLGAEVVVFNALTVDPGRNVMDYSFSESPHSMRRRQFYGATIDLARELDFPIIDVDRIVKGAGTSGLANFVKFTVEHKRLIGAELVRVLREREIV